MLPLFRPETQLLQVVLATKIPLQMYETKQRQTDLRGVQSIWLYVQCAGFVV